jgi:omega-amidase
MTDKITVALIQTVQAWEDKAANFNHFEPLIRDASSADLIVLPEMFSTGFSMNSALLAEPVSGETVTWLQDMSEAAGSTLTGSFIAEEDGQYFNRGFWIAPDASPEFYDKRHLFRMSGEHEHYSPGSAFKIFSIGPCRACLQICYDLRFPAFSRNKNNSYDLLVFVANWPAARRTQWRALLQARAIENQCVVAGVNRIGKDGNGTEYSGDSLLVSPEGDVLVDAKDQDGIFAQEVDLTSVHEYRERFPAWRDQDQFSIDL